MKIGEKVRHATRPDCGIGHVVDIYPDGTLKAEFPAGTFSGVPQDTMVSIEAELLAAKREGLREHVTELLFAGDFERADQIFARDCSEWWTSDSFAAVKKRAVQVTAERKAAQTHATALRSPEPHRPRQNRRCRRFVPEFM